VETIIVVTSDKSYHNNEWVYPYRETDPLGGKDPYSASKSCQEIAVNSFRESFFSDSGIGISSIRAGNVIGGGDWAEHRIIPDLVRGITRGETVKIRNPNAVRPWQHVMEPISGMLTLAEKMQKDLKFSGAWNFGPNDEKGVTVKELVEKFIKYWGEGNYKVQKKRYAKESNYLMLDISKANKILKWFPVFDLDTALKMTIEWYRTYYSNASSINVVSERQISSFLRIV
jgi:CDP-glucose 4,6-dehydratase